MYRRGLLSRYFQGSAAKRLSAVEADGTRSNQHEFNGVNELKALLGTSRTKFPARFIWLGDEQEAVTANGFLTWYDARELHPTRSEYRLYYPSTAVSELAHEGDSLFLARRTDGSVLLIITPADSTIQYQLSWLFGLPSSLPDNFTTGSINAHESSQLNFAVRFILDELGIELEEEEVDELDALLAPLERLPSTKEFSALARNSLHGLSALQEPDATLLAWLNREEQLFRRMERRAVAEKLRSGFMSGAAADVDGFLKFSLSVQNRRKARAGAALENHLEMLFSLHRLRFDRGRETENHNKPDFLFPSALDYHNPEFPADRLIMLGAKSTLKDRWRQVLAEANRIKEKHLLTLEPSVSENQTDQMRVNFLHLVVPLAIQQTFKPKQQADLLSLQDFIGMVAARQN